MKWIALIVLLFGLIGCAAGDQASPMLIATPIENTRVLLPTRSLELTPAIAAVIPATIPPVITEPISLATPIEVAPAPTPAVRSHPTATSTLLECPLLPAPIEVATQVAVQHFEHGLMFWPQERDEIWTLIDSPLGDQFYWRMLPNLWSEGQPESDPNLQPPIDRFQPVRGLGMAWRLGGGSYGPQRDDLGWAIDHEFSFGTTLIYYPQGFYSSDCAWMPKSGIYELRDARGRLYQFVGAGGIARLVTHNE